MIKTEKMIIDVRYRETKDSGGINSLIEDNLRTLQMLIPISSAKVVLERQLNSTPSFHAFAHLEVAGPDIHAVVRDHTLLAAWRKLAESLKKQFERRVTKHQLW